MSFLSFNSSSVLNEARYVVPQKHRSSWRAGPKAECRAGWATGLPQASPHGPSPTADPAQPVARNLSDAIWLETSWTHSWVKMCLPGKESPKSEASHCVVLPVGPKEGPLGHAITSCTLVSPRERVHPHTHSYPHEATPSEPDAGSQEHRTPCGGWSSGGGRHWRPVLLWEPGQGP